MVSILEILASCTNSNVFILPNCWSGSEISHHDFIEGKVIVQTNNQGMPLALPLKCDRRGIHIQARKGSIAEMLPNPKKIGNHETHSYIANIRGGMIYDKTYRENIIYVDRIDQVKEIEEPLYK